MQNEIILALLDASLHQKGISQNYDLSLEQWDELLMKCHQQNILPIIYESILSLIKDDHIKTMIKRKYSMSIIKDVALQAQKTEIFLSIYRYLSEHHIKPIVLKGLVCRHIYPSPDYRISGDEDILVSPDDYRRCVEFMKEFSMITDYDGKEDVEEIKIFDSKRLLMIEMHKVLFPGQSIVNDDWNSLFIDVYSDTYQHEINKTEVLSLSHNHHMLYLILHIFKHFLHSGVGIRQVCDIMMYSQTYGQEIDWDFILQQCKKVNADYFVFALFKICKQYLSLDFNKACIPDSWDMGVDERDLLEDILSGGVYGAIDQEELHSGTYMMNKARHGRFALIRTLFPSLEEMQGKVDYLKDKPYLLPYAWIVRIFDYLRGGHHKAYQKGKQRSELLKKYKVNK